MILKTTKNAAVTGAVFFGLCGAIEAAGWLFLYDYLLKLTGMQVQAGFGKTYDTTVIFKGACLYAVAGAFTGALWGLATGCLRSALGREDGFAGRLGRSSLAAMIALVTFALFEGWDKKALARIEMLRHPWFFHLPYPVRLAAYAAFAYGIYRFWLFLFGRILGIRVLAFLTKRATRLTAGGAAATAVLAMSFGPPILHPAPPPSVAPPTSTLADLADRPNIVLVVLDTVRADHLSAYGYRRPTSPSLEAIAREGVLFERAFSPSPWTLPSHASLFTGLYPATHGATGEHPRLDDEFETLAEILHSRGYRTAGVSSNPMVGRIGNLDQGFDEFHEVWRKGGLSTLLLTQAIGRVTGFEADEGARAANRKLGWWLDRKRPADRPFFLFVNYIEAHAPYRPPGPLREKFLEGRRPPLDADIYGKRYIEFALKGAPIPAEEIEGLRSLYDGDVAYADSMLGRFVEMLRAKGLLDRTILAVLSDHGENLGEHRLIDHQFCLYDTLLHVPVVIRYPPRLPAGLRVKGVVPSAGVFPTILDLAGIADPAAGKLIEIPSLLPFVADPTATSRAYAEYYRPLSILKILEEKVGHEIATRYDRRLRAVRDERFKLIWSSDGSRELYDVEADPAEEKNLAAAAPERARALEEDLDRWLAALPLYEGAGGAVTGFQTDREGEERLRALGYVK